MVALILRTMSNDQNGEVAIEREVELMASPEQIWERITDSSMISEWIGGDVEIEPRPGGRITFSPEGGPGVWGTVEEVVQHERIQWSWRTDDGQPSLIEFELSPAEGGTIVIVRETLLPWRISGPDGFTEWPEASAWSSNALNAA
jgi:uncharacterized protein YndB with AHSA1/START domain